jgi:anaerobic selenocysteine-containing dehydrogenase
MSKPPGRGLRAGRRHLRALQSPDEAEFYTSGRASNEAAFLYQLFVRAYGTNNFPDCSNMCHEASGAGMSETLGVGKGTVVFHDLELADAIFVIGQNPGTNHPRMLEPLREAVKRGAQVVCFNPLKERGLERFQHPQHPFEMLSNGSEPTSSAYFRPALGGDMAAMRGMAKFLLQWERDAQAKGEPAVFDHAFIAEHTSGVDDYLAAVDATTWEHIVEQSGLTLAEIELAARMYRKAERVIMCWAMGVTQHRHSVPTMQEIVNLQLLRGNVGKPGAGLSPVRGHSNVQGDRTMGIDEKPRRRCSMPSKNASSSVCRVPTGTTRCWRSRPWKRAGQGVHRPGRQLCPSHPGHRAPRGAAELRADRADFHQAQPLHLVTGRDALILPCLGRTEIDLQAEGPQGVTVEDSFSMVHASNGQLRPRSPHMRSEPWIIAGMAKATLGNQPVDWSWRWPTTTASAT